MEIVVDERNRLLHVDLSGFKSTVNLSGGYPVFQYASGVKPSKAVALSCLWAIQGAATASRARGTQTAPSRSSAACRMATAACTRRAHCPSPTASRSVRRARRRRTTWGTCPSAWRSSRRCVRRTGSRSR
ncbi:hypothetical protein BISA_0822 [Bifidobacterium saguini DSM 23967]|uniref:Uncharacterized protein n=1 Tax=Bifidobacterium saguini DSM 23967 TaxID=1437607 RepID=A0A087DA72_9BIFI|nr:hypothetical protein BISA_0822 [Bifidobacterium saguini DSM 23967]